MNTNKLTTEQLILIIILMMGLLSSLTSCNQKVQASLISDKHYYIPKHKGEWLYAQPKVEITRVPDHINQ